MKERSFQTEFGRWIKKNMKTSAAFELKSARGISLPFSDVQEHQALALWHAKHDHIYMKIPDVGFQNPFDCFFLSSVEAYVVIRYGSGRWYAIDIDAFIMARDTVGRKSLTEYDAREFAAFIG